ncbi:hypothetical protein [Nocardia arizonensis]|uniref:hypothetical protein n=1 Tax=Nocardia arizonensis TaxID=1141647 RepID=UPI0006D22DD0|nr:hypothetical protein [Nocardia arizonensis]
MTATAKGGPAAVAVMVLIVFSGLFTLVFEVLYLPIYLGSGTLPAPEPEVVAAPAGLAASLHDGAVAFPITALLAAVLNVLLVAAMRTLTDRPGVALLPVAAWLFGFLASSVSGPGGDIMLLSDWPTLALLLCGLVPPLFYAYTRSLVAS